MQEVGRREVGKEVCKGEGMEGGRVRDFAKSNRGSEVCILYYNLEKDKSMKKGAMGKYIKMEIVYNTTETSSLPTTRFSRQKRYLIRPHIDFSMFLKAYPKKGNTGPNIFPINFFFLFFRVFNCEIF